MSFGVINRAYISHNLLPEIFAEAVGGGGGGLASGVPLVELLLDPLQEGEGHLAPRRLGRHHAVGCISYVYAHVIFSSVWMQLWFY